MSLQAVIQPKDIIIEEVGNMELRVLADESPSCFSQHGIIELYSLLKLPAASSGESSTVENSICF